MQSRRRLPALGEGRFFTNTWLLPFFSHHFSMNRFIEGTFKVTHLFLLHNLRHITRFYLPTKLNKVELKQQNHNLSLASPFRKLLEQHILFLKGRTRLMSVSAHSAFWCKELCHRLIAHRFGKYWWWHLQQQQDDEWWAAISCMSGGVKSVNVNSLTSFKHLERRWCQLMRVNSKATEFHLLPLCFILFFGQKEIKQKLNRMRDNKCWMFKSLCCGGCCFYASRFQICKT